MVCLLWRRVCVWVPLWVLRFRVGMRLIRVVRMWLLVRVVVRMVSIIRVRSWVRRL